MGNNSAKVTPTEGERRKINYQRVRSTSTVSTVSSEEREMKLDENTRKKIKTYYDELVESPFSLTSKHKTKLIRNGLYDKLTLNEEELLKLYCLNVPIYKLKLLIIQWNAILAIIICDNKDSIKILKNDIKNGKIKSNFNGND